MKLGIILPPFSESFDRAKALGLDAVEFTMNEGADLDAFESRLPEMKKKSEETGVTVSSIGRWGARRQREDGVLIPSQAEADRRLIDACAFLGCPVFVCNFNFAKEKTLFENYALAIDYLSALIAYGKEKGIKIATYNCEWEGFLVREADWKIVHGHLPLLGIKFDPANSAYNGADPMVEAAHWGDRFYHVHLKGHLIIEGKRVDDPPAGLDDTNWPALIALLVAKGYDGTLSIEPHSEFWNGERGEKGIDYTIRYFQNLLF